MKQISCKPSETWSGEITPEDKSRYKKLGVTFTCNKAIYRLTCVYALHIEHTWFLKSLSTQPIYFMHPSIPSLCVREIFLWEKKSWQSNLAISTSLIIGIWLSFRNRVFTVIPSQSSCTRNSSTPPYFIFLTNTHTKKYKVTDNVSVLKSNKKCISREIIRFC